MSRLAYRFTYRRPTGRYENRAQCPGREGNGIIVYQKTFPVTGNSFFRESERDGADR